MIRILFLSMALLCLIQLAPAQEWECGTPDISEEEYTALPWYGDEDDVFLNTFYDSLESAMGTHPLARGIVQNVWFRIPIHFWIYQISPTNAGGVNPGFLPDERGLQILMDELNTAFRNNGIKIQFYLDCYEYVNNPMGITVDGAVQENTLANSYRKTGKINVHIVDGLDGASGKFNPIYNAIFIRREISTDVERAQTFTHEVGHFLGLVHTHFGKGSGCFEEPVTRGRKLTPCPNGVGYSKRCKWTGDLLCDTPADPNMGGDTPDHLRPNNNDCTYIRGQLDQYGDTYKPAVNNYMAYGNHGCRTNFTSGQIKWMYWWLKNVQMPLSLGAGWLMVNTNTAFDIYEPDNADIAARFISLGETQEHSFFGAASGAWLRFQYPSSESSGILRLEIRDIMGTSPVNEINVYTRNLNGTAGARLTSLVPVVLSGVRYIDLSCATLIPNNEYLVEITRDQNNLGRYEVALMDVAESAAISGPTLICANGNFTVQNQLVNTSVTWSSSNPAGLSIHPTTGVANRVNNFNGQVTVIATISVECGSFQRESEIWLGRPLADINTLIWTGTRGVNPVNTSPGATYVFRVDAVPNTSTYTWVLPSGFSVYGGMNTTSNMSIYITTPTSSGTFTIHCTANNDCGSSWTNSLTLNNGASGGGNNCPPGVSPPCKPVGPIPLVVYPNPASTILIIEDEEASKLEAMSSYSEINTEDSEFNVQLFDNFGVLRKSGVSINRKLELGTINLPNGFYILHIKTQFGIEYRHIRIKH
jgi:hypothetical protein